MFASPVDQLAAMDAALVVPGGEKENGMISDLSLWDAVHLFDTASAGEGFLLESSQVGCATLRIWRMLRMSGFKYNRFQSEVLHMTTIQKTIRIPADRKVHFDLKVPGGVPVGEAEVLMIISPLPVSRRRTLARLAGCLADSPNFSRNPVELQKEMRDEWE